MKISWSGRHTEKWNQIFTLIAASQNSQCAIWMTSRAECTVPRTVPHKPTHGLTNIPVHTETFKKHLQIQTHIHMYANKVHRLTLINANITKTHNSVGNKMLLIGFTVWVWIKLHFALWSSSYDRVLLIKLSIWTAIVGLSRLYLYAMNKSEPNMQRETQTSNYSSGWHDIFCGVGLFKTIFLFVSPISNQLSQYLVFNGSFSFPLQRYEFTDLWEYVGCMWQYCSIAVIVSVCIVYY